MSTMMIPAIVNAPPSGGVGQNIFTGKTIVFEGDSITYGVGSSSNANRYATLTVNELGAIEDNQGLNGRVMQDGVTGGPCIALHPVFYQALIPVKTTDHAALVFALGTNDVGVNNGTMNVTDYGTTYRAAITYAINSRGWPTSRILLLTPFFITGYDQYLGSCDVVTQGNQTRLFEYRDEVIDIAGEFGVAVLNICDEMNGEVGLLTIDGVHPSDTGHQFISDKVVAALQQLN